MVSLFPRTRTPIHFFRRPLVALRKMSSAAPLLLSPRELQELKDSNSVPVSLLDATWFMPNSPRNAKEEFLAKHIPASQHLDLDEVASPHELGLKHMLPDPETFAKACEKLGISPSTHVVVYDAHGVFSSPRALFMFRTFGHKKSSLLDGGLPRWMDEKLPVDSSAPIAAQPVTYPPPSLNDKAIRSYEQMVSNGQLNPTADSLSEIVLDARSHGRYTGIDPEPRAGLSSGHMPHSYSLAFNSFLQQKTTADGQKYTMLLPPSEIRKVLESAVGAAEAKKIIDGERSVITTCGSGMTAAVLWLGLQLLGAPQVSLYDESWTGYAMRPSSEIEKSA